MKVKIKEVMELVTNQLIVEEEDIVLQKENAMISQKERNFLVQII